MLNEMVYRYNVRFKIAYVDNIAMTERFVTSEAEEKNVTFYALKEITENDAYMQAMQLWYSNRMAYADSITGIEVTDIYPDGCACERIQVEVNDYFELLNVLCSHVLVEYK